MKKSKIILGFISVMVFVLTLFIALPNKVYASEVDDYIEENYSNLIFSNNLLPNSEFEGTFENTSFGVQSFNLPSGIYTIKVYGTINTDGVYQLWFDMGGNADGGEVWNMDNELTFTITEQKTAFRIYTNGSVSNPKIMLNKGTQSLPYEPYIIGSMIYNQGYQQGLLENATSVLYKAFNGATAKLMHNNVVVLTDSISISENDLYLSINNMSGIMDYLNEDESNRYYSLSISLNSAINNELVVLLNNSILDTSLTLSNSLGGYQESFSRTETSLYSIIANSQSRYYDTVVYDALYPPDYIDFKLNLDLTQLSYKEGYDAGVEDGLYKGTNQGYQDGYYKGYDAGELKGYEEGYNEGAESNIEIAGMRTLFNSILSYPVNMISTIFDFDFMGVNITSLIMFIVSLGIVIFVVKKFW